MDEVANPYGKLHQAAEAKDCPAESADDSGLNNLIQPGSDVLTGLGLRAAGRISDFSRQAGPLILLMLLTAADVGMRF
jgi:hypothetical protein